MQRKAAGILMIEKEEGSAGSLVKALKVRDGSPLDVPILRFGWNTAIGRHVYLGDLEKEDAKVQKIGELRRAALAIFDQKTHLAYKELQQGLMEAFGVQERTTRSYMNVLKDAGIIEKSAQFPGNFTLSIAKVHPD